MLLNKLIIKNEKGFNLFTALVSFLLISISLILIFNMIRTEESYLKLLQDQSSTSDLITIADLARADAYNRFIVGLRSEWEGHMSHNTMEFGRKDLDLNWPEFVNVFAVEYFFGHGFTGYLSSSIVQQLNYTENPAGYSVQCYTDVNHEDNTDTELFGSILTQAFNDAGNKIDVVNCDQYDEEECVGSFYFTLDTRMLSDENYEKLPIVFVKDAKTQAVIEKPILGRQVYKIYMPWRGFQALRTARRLAFSPDREMSNDPINYSAYDDNGLFNPLLHNTLEQARLGICDPGTCAPRNDFFSTPHDDGFNAACSAGPGKIDFSPNSVSITINGTNVTTSDSISNYAIDKTHDAFEDLIETTVTDNLQKRILGNETLNYRYDIKGNATGLIMICNNSNCDCLLPNPENSEKSLPSISCINVDTPSKVTKNVIPGVTLPIPSGTTLLSPYFVSSQYPATTNVAEGAGGPGLFLGKDGFPNLGSIIWTDNWRDNVYHGVAPDANNSNLKCSELETIKYSLVFKEENQKYKISTGPIYIRVNLIDNYTPFSYIPNLNEWAQEDPNSKYLTVNNNGPAFTYNPSTNPSDWKCSSYETESGSICVPSSN